MKFKKFTKSYLPILALVLVFGLGSCLTDEFEPQIHDGDIYITSMADLDQFRKDRIIEVTGNLEIGRGPNGLSDITSLGDLSRLERVGGNLLIFGTQINNFSGLENLQSANSVIIDGNPNLETLNDLPNLSMNEFHIGGNDALRSLEGLSDTQSLEALSIYDNGALTSLKGLEFLTEAATVTLSELPGITSFEGLNNLKSVSQNLLAFDLPGIRNLNGLGALESVQAFRLKSIPLESFSGLVRSPAVFALMLLDPQFSDLDIVSGFSNVEQLHILQNETMTNLNGIESIPGLKTLFIGENKELTSLNGLSTESALEEVVIDQDMSLVSLDGVQHLNQLTTLNVNTANSLQDLAPLTQSHFELMQITGAPLLTNLNGLESIETINVLYLSTNNNLSNIDGLANATMLRWLSIDGMPNLRLDSFPFAVAQEMDNVTLSGLHSITGVGGFENLTHIKVGLRLQGLQALDNLDGFSGLTSADYLEIRLNNELLTLDALNALTETGRLNIQDNQVLDNFCGLQNLVQNEEFGENEFTLRNNAFNPTEEDIRSGNCKAE